MAEPFLAEIRIVGFNFAPRHWALCNGQILSIAQNTALFSLLGTTYGGNGQTTFALPNMQSRTPLHPGNGAGLTPRVLGEQDGSPSVTLISTEMPSHTHVPQAATTSGVASPQNNVWGTLGRGRPPAYASGVNTLMNVQSVGIQGGSQPHNNMQPYLTLNFIIALEGIFPARS